MKRVLLLLLIACGAGDDLRGTGRPCVIPAHPNLCACGALECTACVPDVLTELDGLGTVRTIQCAGR